MNRKTENSIPCKIIITENFSPKLCTRDYRVGKVGSFPQLDDFFDCPVMSCPFFSITRQARTVGPIFTLCGLNDVVPRKEVLLG